MAVLGAALILVGYCCFIAAVGLGIERLGDYYRRPTVRVRR